VSPAQALVLVDGNQVERAADGTVPIEGPVGSSHTVAIHWGAAATYKQVVITDKGPVAGELFGGPEGAAAVGATPAPQAPAPHVPATGAPVVQPNTQF